MKRNIKFNYTILVLAFYLAPVLGRAAEEVKESEPPASPHVAAPAEGTTNPPTATAGETTVASEPAQVVTPVVKSSSEGIKVLLDGIEKVSTGAAKLTASITTTFKRVGDSFEAEKDRLNKDAQLKGANENGGTIGNSGGERTIANFGKGKVEDPSKDLRLRDAEKGCPGAQFGPVEKDGDGREFRRLVNGPNAGQKYYGKTEAGRTYDDNPNTQNSFAQKSGNVTISASKTWKDIAKQSTKYVLENPALLSSLGFAISYYAAPTNLLANLSSQAIQNWYIGDNDGCLYAGGGMGGPEQDK